MSKQHGTTYRPWEPQRDRQEAQSPEAKLPEGDVVFFLLDTVPQLARRPFDAPDETDTRGAPPCDPAMLVGVLLYADGVGVFSSRTITLACERHLACMALVGQDRPDFRPISDCRTRPLEALKAVVVQVVRLAGEAGLVHVGNVATDGPTIQGNAARHKARSDGSMPKAVERLREAMETFVTHASQPDEAAEAVLGSRRGEAWPAALARREDRLAPIAAARRRGEARAQAEADAARQRRAEVEAERARTGPPRRGTVPQPVDATPPDQAPTTFTDPELPLMHTKNTGWESGGNAPLRVDGACQILFAGDVTDAANDTPQAEPVAQATLATLTQAGLARPQAATGKAHAIPATLENGYDSEAAAQALEG
jgi:transposase